MYMYVYNLFISVYVIRIYINTNIYLNIICMQYVFNTCYIRYNFIMYTSSTAQGGGGSFKNRKPIGEVGCRESGMAERIH